MFRPLFLLLIFLTSLNAEARICFREKILLEENNFLVKISRYRPAESIGHVLIVPPTGGTNVLDRSYARGFCANGLTSIIVEEWSGLHEYNLELSIHTRFYARAQKAIEIALSRIPEEEFVGILGTSVGGLHAAIATGRLPRIKAAFVITAGADIPTIIANSDQNAMVNARQKRMKLYGFKTHEQYIHALRDVIVLDPLKLASGYFGKELGMIIATHDTTIPTPNQRRLQELWKPQTLIEINGNHFYAIMVSWLIYQREITPFFVRAARNRS